MSFFKKIFGIKDNSEQKPEIENKVETKGESVQISYEDIPWMTESRLKSISICLSGGFTPARSLPTELNRQIRPSIEIALRLHAIKGLVLWLMAPKEVLPDKKILNFIEQNQLRDFMTEEERLILNSSRDDEAIRNSIGWKFENAWSLAWYFGYVEPEISGKMMSGEQMQDILMNHTCSLDENVKDWIKKQDVISEERLIQKEDLFYCLHNAVRSAQFGRETVPKGFDPNANGGVIHERRHALTWMLSKDTKWEETDLST